MCEVLLDPDIAGKLDGCSFWIDSKGYPAFSLDGQRFRVHRFVMSPPPGFMVDHINRVKTDCRRENLRLATQHQNARNSKMRAHNKSGYRGVYLCSHTGRWRAEIRVNGKGLKLGRFARALDAAIAYDEAAEKHHGSFAVTNYGLGLLSRHWSDFTDPSGTRTGRGCE